MTIGTSIKPGKSYDPSWGENPFLQSRKTILSFLQGLFEFAGPGCFHWDADREATEIFITDEGPLSLDVIGMRPAISVVRAPAAFGRTSLDQLVDINATTNVRKHTDLMSSTFNVNCCSSEALESEYIAWIVANNIWLLRRLMIKGTSIHDIGQGLQIGSPSPAGAIVSGDTEGEWINTVVTVPFYVQVAGQVTPKNQQMVNAIKARIGARGGAQVGEIDVRGQQRIEPVLAPGQQVNLRPPTIRGRPIRTVAVEQNLSEE